MKETSTLKTTMQKLLLFLPLFFVSIAFGMDKKSPPSLRYLAAQATRDYLYSDKVPHSLKHYAHDIRYYQNRKKELLEEKEREIDQNQLESMVGPYTHTAMIEVHLNDALARNPAIFNSKFKQKLLALSLSNGKTDAARWILHAFSEMKKDQELYAYFKKSIVDGNIPTYTWCIDVICPHYLEQKTQEILDTLIIGNEPKITADFLTRLKAQKNTLEKQILQTIEETTKKLQHEVRWNYRRSYYEVPFFITEIKKLKNNFLVMRPFVTDKESLRNLLTANLHSLAREYISLDGEFATLYLDFLLQMGADRLAPMDTNHWNPNQRGKIPLQTILDYPIRSFREENGDDGYGSYKLCEKRIKTIESGVLLLLAQDAGQQIHWTDPQGNTPLHERASVFVLDTLIEHGGQIHTPNKQEETPLESFIKNNDADYFCRDHYSDICRFNETSKAIFIDLFRRWLVAGKYQFREVRTALAHLQSGREMSPILTQTYKEWDQKCQQRKKYLDNYVTTPASFAAATAVKPYLPKLHPLHLRLVGRTADVEIDDFPVVEKTAMQRMEEVD